MNLGGDRYRKIQMRSERTRRWASMRREGGAKGASSPPGTGAKFVGQYLIDDEKRPVNLKKAGIIALVVHFLFFALIIPSRAPEEIPLDRAAATVVRIWAPPAPPAKAKKTRKRNAPVVPIPTPTPEDPEPIEPETSDADYGDFDEAFAVGDPTGAPGISSGARGRAVRAGEGGILAPVPVREVDPEYTPEATRKGIQGEVLIEAVVDIEGRVIEPRLLRGLADEELNRNAMEAIQRWLFRPGMKDGEAVAVIAVFKVTYRLH